MVGTATLAVRNVMFISSLLLLRTFFRETIVTAMVKAPEFENSYEIGPGTVCRGILKRFGKKTPVVSVQA